MGRDEGGNEDDGKKGRQGGSNHSRAVVRADFAWTDGGQCVDGRQIHAESRVGRPRSDVVGALYMFRA